MPMKPPLLSDFYMLELYFEQPETAQFYEDLSRRYGAQALKKAVMAGYLVGKQLTCGPDCGRKLLWLSDKGRQKAQTQTLN